MAMIARRSKRRSPSGLMLIWVVSILAWTSAFAVVEHQPSSGAVPFVVIAVAPLPTPTECSDFAVSFGGGATWTQATFNTPTTGGTDSGLTVTITFTGIGPGGEPIFDWTSSQPVDAVFVKAGFEGFLYLYDPEAPSDTGLTSPRDSISHITFCFDDDPPTATTTPPTTTTLTTTPPTTTTLTTTPPTTTPPGTATTPTTTTTSVGTAPTTSTTTPLPTVPTLVLPAVEVAQAPDPVDASPTFTG